NLTPAERDEWARQLARFAGAAAVRSLLAERLTDPAASPEVRGVVLRAMARSGLKETPEAWLTGLTQVLSGGDAELVREAVATARALRLPKQRPGKLIAARLPVAGDARPPAEERLRALDARPG